MADVAASVLEKLRNKAKNSPDEKLNIVDGSKIYFVIRDYFRDSTMQNENVVNKLIRFVAADYALKD